MASFVYEKLYLDRGVSGQKRVNFVIHGLCASLIALLLWLLLVRAGLSKAAPIAVALATIWLVSPLWVSTVLYSVQRMAQLSALFMLCALNAYALWRIYRGRYQLAGLALVMVPVFVTLAALSKENGLLIVPLLVLMELLWFQFRGAGGELIPWLKYVTLSMLGLGVLAVITLQILYPEFVYASYELRDFNLQERVMTEGRILWQYLGQFLLPDTAAMGVYHDDVQISRGWWQPVSTFWAGLSWLAVIGLGAWLCRYRRGRYAAFGIALYLVGHAVESTVLALELYFEHRSYFPVLGLLVLAGLVLGELMRRLPALAAPTYAVLAVYAGTLLLQTGTQAYIWSSDELMRINTAAFHPKSRRANINMAVLQARFGALDEALAYSQRAADLKLERVGDKSVRDLLLSCYANTPLPEDVFVELPLWQAQERVISRTNAFHFLVRDLQNDKCPAIHAEAIAQGFESVLLSDGTRAWALAEVYAGLAVLENSLQRYQQGLAYAILFEESNPSSPRALLMQLHFASALDRQDVVSSTIEQLSWLREAGKLNRQQRDTLALYNAEEPHAAD